VLTRQKLPVLDRGGLGAAAGVLRGGYVLYQRGEGAPQAILLATGSELHLALEAARRIEDLRVRVVSLPCWEVFRRQPQHYRDEVLPPAVRARVSLEAAARQGWLEWVTDAGICIGIDHFGASAPGERLFQEFGITVDAAIAAVRRVVAGARP